MPRNLIPSLIGVLKMATRNYRQAKRSREESRKKRQQEKILRKVNRDAATAPAAPSEPNEVVDAATKEVS
jgi:hypothetical protein